MTPDQIAALAADQPPFARLLGLRITHASPDRVEAELPVTEALTNRNGQLHGGAIMALADNLGGTATFLNLRPGEGTVTVESKTNFFRPLAPGSVATAQTEPLHRGPQDAGLANPHPDGRGQAGGAGDPDPDGFAVGII